MMEGEASSSRRKKTAVPNDYGFIDTVFSWSLEDILNENLYKEKVKQIPLSFQSVSQYFESFVFPLLEETRAQLFSTMEKVSKAPFAEVVALEDSKPYGAMLYDVKVDCWRNRFSNPGKEPYKTLPGDILVLADAKPETASDLQRVGRMWTFVSVTKITEDENEIDTGSTYFKVKTSKEIQIDRAKKSLFVIFLTNITSNRRIWKTLHRNRNLKIIKEILRTDSGVDENCELCSMQSEDIWNEIFGPRLSSTLNDSQEEAVLSCLRHMHCDHKTTVELIWGPPGTGKTKTVSVLLIALLKMNCRTLICSPTNVAIVEVASRVVKLVKESVEGDPGRDILFFPLGEILLFGNNERLKVDSGVEEIYLDYRVKRLADCFAPLTGWRHCFASMIDFLDDCVPQYHIYMENESMKQSEDINGNEIKEKECRKDAEVSKVEIKTFLEFVRERFKCTAAPLRSCIFNLGTHLPKSYIGEDNFQVLGTVISFLDSFETLLFQDNMGSEDLEELFSHSVDEDFSQSIVDIKYTLHESRSKCHSVLRELWNSFKELNLPSAMNMGLLKDFCFTKASLIFCTASSSYKLHSVAMEQLKFLVIDEAAQLKESESAIPLQLPCIQHAILVGDECQLPAMVESSVSGEAYFGRSLFERLSYLGHSKHLLSMQYRMHPSISFFPNSYFYENKILDAPTVRKRSYEKQFLPGPMYGPYAFINVFGGREEFIEHSCRNMVEVSVVMKILLNLYKAWVESKEKLSIGIVSPYSAQVIAIQEKLGSKYEKSAGFAVKVTSIDGFQGGEEDIIIISTVRSNNAGSIGFTSSPQRINVALTRARHCLWILGRERTLTRSESVWKTLLDDAKARQCFFNVDEDKDLAKAILEVKKELDELDELLNPGSILFRSERWKVNFSDNFLKSFKKLTSDQTKKSVINLLLKLSGGWRPKRRNVDSVCASSSHIIKQFKVEGFYIISTIDIAKDVKESQYIQVLKVWDILPLEDVQKLVTRLDNIFVKYTDEFINLCKEKCFDGNLEVPKTWAVTSNIVRFKNLADNESGSDLSGAAFDCRSYVENSNVTDSLLLMKFYPLSSGIVSHLLSDRDGRELDLPFEVTDEQLEMILFPRSTFILGRSGTGKTTILTMKLFQNEKHHHMAKEQFYGVNNGLTLHTSREVEAVEGLGGTERYILHQLFVTVSPKLCFAVKQHISHMKSAAFGEKLAGEGDLIDIDDIDDAAQFKDIPNSFVDIPAKSYPLVITFHKFLIMLDGTLGNSYFERFHDIRKHYGQVQNSRSLFIQNFIRTKEVGYERFSSSYWPHFNAQLTKKLDPSRVFIEIISHIKGGVQSIDVVDGKLSREDYVKLSDTRVSTLNKPKRERIYEIFESYEQMKMRNGEFDLADLVNDLHHRLKEESYKGDEFHFVYIDEVQDLTMSQIALFKYICRNIEKGFVFSGDTAQTIARGIDFRFQDIRSLFYKKFVLESRNTRNVERQEKGQLSDIFNLSQNFRTHVGVLNLAQSVIELLYRFFPHSVDILKPETSLIYGEPPVLLESGNDENAIIKIFGNSGDAGGNMVGFGAEQVILVRDDCQALVLTIVESKGLEFQDVLLYDFFGSSPLKNQWRVVYEYMKEQALLDSTLPASFPSFNEAKHNVLCPELKQLYVAITRTRQRLWIWENMEEFSKPMFDYWKKRLLVQVRQLDDSLAQAMQVASSPEEWKSRGIKLFYENNYEMATICFEKAKDTYWEGRSKATGLKAASDHIRSSNPLEANVILREAANIFEAIGKADSAAKCFYDLGEYERAGKIYEERCGKPELEKAGECFFLAGQYKHAAEVYARGNFFSECLAVCSRGELFEIGLQYINYWKQHADTDVGLVRRSKEINKVEQDFLQSCALHYYQLNDKKSMMKFVKAFHSMDLMRNFLKSKSCFDELLVLEEEAGNFMDAANIARLTGDILLTADLLQKAGNFKEACNLTLNYVLSNSLWSPGSKGWPLKQFTEKKELFEKAKSLAKSNSNQFYEFVCTEASILSNDESDLFIMNQQLNASKRHQSICGETLSARKILDCHLKTNSCKYGWEDEFVLDLKAYSEETICRNWVTVQTLVYFWDYWKGMIVNVFEYLGCLKSQDANDYRSYGDFCLNYLGVWKQYDNLNTIYLLLNSDAEWVSTLDNRHAPRRGKLAAINVHQLVSAGRSYWSSELLSVGMKVLGNLEALHKQLSKNSPTVFSQVLHLTCIYEVAKFLLSSEYLNRRYYDEKILQKFVELSTEHFFDFIFPVDWRESLKMNMITLRGTESYKNIIKEVIFKNIGLKGIPSYGQIGTTVVTILGSGKLGNAVYERVAKRFDENSPWKEFFESLSWNMGLESCQESASYNNSDELKGVSHISKFYRALVDTYSANWRGEDYITPANFLYLIERFLILLSSLKGYIFTTKSSFVDWLIYQEGNTISTCSSLTEVQQFFGVVLDFVVTVVQNFIYKEREMIEWIQKSHTKNKQYHSLVVLRLVVIISLLHLNFGGHSLNLLIDLLGMSYIRNKLPWEFYDALRRRRKRNLLNVIAEAFKKIGNPLVLVSLGDNCPKFACPDAIFVDMVTKRKEDILEILFPVIEASRGHAGAAKMKATNLQSNVLYPDCYEQGKSSSISSSSAPVQDLEITTLEVKAGDLPVKLKQFWNIFEALEFEDNGIDTKTIVFKSSTIKEDVKKSIQLLSAALDGCFQKNSFHGEDKSRWDEAARMLEDLKKLDAALDGVMSDWKHEHLSTLVEIYERLQSSRPKLEPLLNLLFQQYINCKGKSLETGVASAGNVNVENTDSNADECSGSHEGKIIPTSATSASEAQGSSQKPVSNRAGTSKSKKNKKKKGGKKQK
ncbi:UvrD-like helicase ATP-binding domain-containing protein [Citrus sinensis]|nr:UvrD-like helicase ATP-binding domain-containing protein [Citrus sinensis]